MIIAVIGATGMIGHHTAKAVVETGHNLIILHRASTDFSKIKDLSFQARLVDFDEATSIAEGLLGVDAVIHCGAYYPTVPRKWQEDVLLAKKQMETFYDACKIVPLEKIVYVGAAIALQKHSEGKPGNEELFYKGSPPNKTPYLQVKYELDRLAVEYAEKGMPIVIGIPSMCLGEFDYGPSTGRLVVDICNGKLPVYIEGNRNLVYAGDAGRGLVLAAEKGIAGERYLFTGTNVTMKELTAKIAEIAGVNAPSKRLPLTMAKILVRLFEGQARLTGATKVKLDSTAVAVMALGQFLDGTKAEKELGFSSNISLDDTIARTIAWFKEAKYI